MGRVAVWAGSIAAAFLLLLVGAVSGVTSLAFGGNGCPAGAVACDGGDGLPADPASLPPGFTLPPGTPPPVATAIAWAVTQVGTPYTFGGDCTAPHSGIAAHQCDCSSLMQASYRAAGIAIPRTTYEQVHVGAPISTVTEVKPGDLIFIPGSDGTPSKPGHVGMAIGGGLLVQAPHTGDVVKISTIVGWASQLAAIRRIVTG